MFSKVCFLNLNVRLSFSLALILMCDHALMLFFVYVFSCSYALICSYVLMFLCSYIFSYVFICSYVFIPSSFDFVGFYVYIYVFFRT